MELPSLTTLKTIFDRLKANDIAWFKEQWTSGGFDWLKDRLPAGEYDQVGSRVDAGDLNPLRGALGKLDLPGVDLFKGLAGNAGNLTGNVAGAAGAATGAAAATVGASAAKLGGTATAGVAGATAVVDGGNRKKGGLMWVIPALIAAALLAFGLSRCGGSSSTTTDTTLAAAEDTFAVEETVAASEDTVAAETTVAAVETTVAAVTETSAAEAAAATGDILATADGAGSFKTLGAAINAAGLADTLKGEGPFTVFAPTDDAFAKLPTGVVDALLKPENKDALTKVLTYHVVPGMVMAADVKAGKVSSVEGSPLTITTDGGVKVNGVNVTSTDVAATNGVIHVLDGVLVPPSVDIAALLRGSAPTTAAAAAAAAAAPESLTVYFANASAALNAEAQAKIDGAVATLKKLPSGSKVGIVGHASKTGDSARNEALSIARANNVKAALEKGLGDTASGITFTVEARGDTQPDEDETKSRKVTIEIQP